jgi:matrixin
MSRRLAELDRLDEQRSGADAGTAGSRRRVLGRRGLLYLLSVAVVAFVFLALSNLFPDVAALRPAAGTRTREPSSAATGPHAFMNTTPSGRPVSYDPCRPIPYAVNPTGMPAAGAALIDEAIAEINKATGLTFVGVGTTQEPPGPQRDAARPSEAGQTWPPLLIAWVTAAEYPMVGNDTEGVGGSTYYQPDGPESARYVTGQVVLERDRMAELLAEGDGHVRARAIVIHELAHVVGLDHVDDPGELMAPTYTGLTGLGPGDRQGLTTLGAGPCWPTARPR